MNPDNSNASGILDGLFGTVDRGFDLWSKWTDAKADARADRADIPSIVTQAAPGSLGNGMNMQTVAIIAAAGLGLLLILRK